MQAYKLKGKIDRSGKLIITEPTNLDPGDVEVIILQSAITENKPSNNESLKTQNQLFWQGESIESLIDTQQPPIVEDIKILAGDYWGDDAIDDFLTFVKKQRKLETTATE
ncbi:MAG: hypothetical protein RLZZ535_3802 [Cyanobacteriota bacterium]|jgi:hypothetical protein